MAFSEYMNFTIVCTIFGKQFIEKLQMKNDKFFKSRGNKHARERKRVVSQVFLQQKIYVEAQISLTELFSKLPRY